MSKMFKCMDKDDVCSMWWDSLSKRQKQSAIDQGLVCDGEDEDKPKQKGKGKSYKEKTQARIEGWAWRKAFSKVDDVLEKLF